MLYNNFIPTSLYVTIELVNVGQAYFIASDLELYDEALDCPCQVRASNMSQELGVVSNVFSDKTGTLTRNEMKFVKFIIDDIMYEVTSESNEISKDTSESHKIAVDEVLVSMEQREYSDSILNVLNNPTTSKAHADKIIRFLQCLSTCHTIVREADGTYRCVKI